MQMQWEMGDTQCVAAAACLSPDARGASQTEEAKHDISHGGELEYIRIYMCMSSRKH